MSSQVSERSPTNSARALIGVCLLGAYALVITRTAWVSDDAFITLRTVANFVEGHGLRWNIDERVQVYTHPLWMFCLSAVFALVRDPYFSAVALSVSVSMLAMGSLWLVARTPLQAATVGAALLMSKGFIDFSTSGLENPLTHALLGALVWLALHKPEQLALHVGVAALLATSRLDALLLALPLVAMATLTAYRQLGPRKTARALVLGASPLWGWLIFALFYYGFALPNTAYAKLYLGIAQPAITRQGLVYLLNTVSWDPWLAVTLLITAALAFSSRERVPVCLALGAALYTAYVVHVGGDFMAGRFLTAPLFAAALACATCSVSEFDPRALPLSLLAPATLLYSSGGSERWPVVHEWTISGVADERAYYHDCMGLMMWTRTGPLPCQGMRDRSLPLFANGQRVSITYNVGVAGYYVPRDHHVIDPFALTDALLARLPVTDPSTFRVGHYGRTVPNGYAETVRDKRCRLESRALCAYHDKLQQVIAGPLWSRARFAAIAGFALGRYDHELRAYLREIGHPSVQSALTEGVH